jgi:uncharacterized protein (TIGR02145 family)
MKSISKFALTASIGLALSFTLSCSSGDDGNIGSPSSCPVSAVSENSVTCGGQTYRTVNIGDQVWFAENLNYKASGSKCYGNDPKNAEKYGRLYNWETAKKACPSGWHLPSKKEWDELVNFAGGEDTAGKKLKAKSGWYDNGNGTDEYGFSALPGGFGNSCGSFSIVGYYGNWWSSSEYGSSYAYYRVMDYSDEDAYWNDYGKSYLFSVRCVQDKA